MGEEFPESLKIAQSDLINTVVNKMITAEDQDGVEEFIKQHKIPAASDMYIRQYCQNKADEIWGPWEELPLPKTYDAAIKSLRDAKGRLANEGVTSLEDAENFSAGALVDDYMTDFKTNQTGWKGNTIDAMRRNYIGQWGRMVFLQSNTLQVLILMLEAYKAQVDQAQKDIVALVKDAKTVVDSYSSSSLCGSGSDKKNAIFNIAIAVGAVIALAEGWPAVVATVAAGGLSVAKDAYKVDEPKEHPLGGDSVSEIWQNAIDATEKLRKMYEESEKDLANMTSGFYDILGDNVTVDKNAYGSDLTIPAYKLIRAQPLSSTNSVEPPDRNYSPPPPVHIPDR